MTELGHVVYSETFLFYFFIDVDLGFPARLRWEGTLRNVVGLFTVLALVAVTVEADTNQERMAELVHLQTTSVYEIVRDN